ncbi:pyridine nucleotide-disulfide oxidoreductase [Thraustotheca clavata]|uniref:Pyridine nucleotide-disulfide oxidoreductase n=1 Tax=Thraustotheca clavata TaxID=74557 RepID=A0A1W0A5S9_9STRA|nr:pyridine nucleotide-disulfide oxidoreductase [Thraustotheca clavata]
MPQEIVIVGGGYAGLQLAQQLACKLPANTAHVTLVEKHAFSFHCIGLPRALVDKTYTPKLFIPLDKALPDHATLVLGVAEVIHEHDIVVRSIQDGEISDTTTILQFDYLILATGSSYAPPIKVGNNVYNRSTIEASIAETFDKVAAAQSILVIGGGSVGCEIAGEIATTYLDKKVTLVDGNKELVANANLSAKFRTKLAAALTSRGVALVLGERLPEKLTAHSFENKTFSLSGGTQVTTDVQLVCAGVSPNTQIITTLDANLADPQGIKVKPNLQLDDERYPNIFVIGDASNHVAPKTAMSAGEQAKFLAAALTKKIRKGKGIDPFVPASVQAMLIPVGREGGVAQLPMFGGVFAGDWLVKMAKCKDYFAGAMWSTWKASLPKMSKFHAIAHGRRSISHFLPKEIDQSIIHDVLLTTRRAPSSLNTQPYVCVIVQDAEEKNALSAAMAGGNPRKVQEAPLLAVFAADLEPSKLLPSLYEMNDKAGTDPIVNKYLGFKLGAFGGEANHTVTAWAYKQTMIAAATFVYAVEGHGVGTQVMEGFDEPKLREILGIPDRYSVPVVIACGYPDFDKITYGPTPRLPTSNVFFSGKFGQHYKAVMSKQPH